MSSFFSADFFIGNRQRLQELCTRDVPIVITAHGLLQRNSDTAFPFRQDSYFWYLTGINQPDITLVIDDGKEYLIAPERDDTRETFDGTIDNGLLSGRSGIDTVLEYKEGWRRLGARMKRVRQAATLSPPMPFVESLGIYTNPARHALTTKMKTYNSNLELMDLRPQLTRMRSTKQSAELDAMQHAIDITIDTLQTVLLDISSYAYEYEVEAAITGSFRRVRSGHAYQPIVAAGKNACTLHYVENDAALKKNDLLLLDVGAEIEGYAADITRTYPIGRATKRQRQVLNAVLDVQTFAQGLLKPGVMVKKCEAEIEVFMGEKLRELGLIKTIDHQTVREFYPHATSHFLGLDVHDVGDYEAPLEPGMVLTIEPGIYIPQEGIGVRIEDDALITSEGVRLLSERLPGLAS